MTKEDKLALDNIYGKGNWKIKLGHGNVETLYIKRNGEYIFEAYEYNRVLNNKEN